MRLFREPLFQLNEYECVRKDLEEGRYPVYVEGCVDAQKTHWMASFTEDYPFKLIVTHSEKRVKEIYENYCFFDKNILHIQVSLKVMTLLPQKTHNLYL